MIHLLKKMLARCDPNSKIVAAERKRKIERALRADGWSRAAARVEAAKRFKGMP